MPALYSGVAVLLVVAVVAVAYGTQAPQLGVAEFAPAARQAVEPPPTTAGDVSAGAGRGQRSPRTTQPAVATTTTAGSAAASGAPGTTRVGRARTCVGNPPRQTDDPQSPPCVAVVFEGDNGGATSTGVTGTEIKIGVPMTGFDKQPVIDTLFEFFNQRYEFYGRRLVPVYVQTPDAGTPTGARKAAVDVASQQVFGAVGAGLASLTASSAGFFQELARQHVVVSTLGKSQLLTDRTVFDQFHPYLWSVYQSVEDRSRAIASFYCSSLVGRPARHAGGALATQTRKVAIIRADDFTPASSDAVESGLAQCDVVPVTGIQMTSADAASTDTRRTALESLRTAGVTDIVCVCGGSWFTSLYSVGANIGFRPEWLPTHYIVGDEFFGGTFAGQHPSVLLLASTPKLLPHQVRPSFQAVQATNPGLMNAGVTVTDVIVRGGFVYSELALLAAGIQGAGPALTADAFAQALMSMQFPNPGAGQAPYWQPAAGFGAGDHSLYNDYALAWWGLTAETIDPGAPVGRGSWCYVNQGARYRAGTFPADADSLFFDSSKPCR